MPNKRDYNDFNKALDTLMGANEFKQSATAAMADTDELTGVGRLIVQVFLANGAVPIQNAKVTITDDNKNVVSELTTNNSGRTPSVELPAPSARLSLEPADIKPYSTYNIRVEYPGFYTEEFLNVPVFDRIESIQPVSMEAVSENSLPTDKIVDERPTVQGPTRDENQPENIEGDGQNA